MVIPEATRVQSRQRLGYVRCYPGPSATCRLLWVPALTLAANCFAVGLV